MMTTKSRFVNINRQERSVSMCTCTRERENMTLELICLYTEQTSKRIQVDPAKSSWHDTSLSVLVI